MTPERIAELLDTKDDYRELRLAVGKLKGGPWEHTDILGVTETFRHTPWYDFTPETDPTGFHRTYGKDEYVRACGKCGCEMDEHLNYPDGSTCPIPDPDRRPLEVIAGELVRKCDACKLESAILMLLEMKDPDIRDRSSGRIWRRFAYMTPAEQIVCCLQAMEVKE